MVKIAKGGRETTVVDGDERDDKSGGRIELFTMDLPFQYIYIYNKNLQKLVLALFSPPPL